ncbi:hypothetical protein LTR40_011699, partial [Exophiala xenobiotica]
SQLSIHTIVLVEHPFPTNLEISHPRFDRSTVPLLWVAMTVRKQYPPRNYETFPEEGASESQTSSGSDKSRTAAAEAQRLGSLGSWADNFAGQTPATNRTPTASTVDGDEVRNVQYPQLSQEPDPSDPPPVYTPSDTTASRPPTEPASPVAQRSVPAQPET